MTDLHALLQVQLDRFDRALLVVIVLGVAMLFRLLFQYLDHRMFCRKCGRVIEEGDFSIAHPHGGIFCSRECAGEKR